MEKNIFLTNNLNYLTILKNNHLTEIPSQKDFDDKKQKAFLFGLRKSFKDKSYQIHNPIKAPKLINKEEIKYLSKKL